jgi:hypothetical protein
MTNDGVTLCAIFRVPLAGVAAFQAYEAAVPPLLRAHHGALQHRLRAEPGTSEIHVSWFPSVSALNAYRADPRRAAHAARLDASGAVSEVLIVADVTVP